MQIKRTVVQVMRFVVQLGSSRETEEESDGAHAVDKEGTYEGMHLNCAFLGSQNC